MRWILTALLLVTGCAAPIVRAPTTLPAENVPVLKLCESMELVGLWAIEAQSRFERPVLIAGHGGVTHGEWSVSADDVQETGTIRNLPPYPVEWIIKIVRLHFPDRPIVLIICNPAGIKLHGHPNVWYARDDIWVVPDRFSPVERKGATVGSIQEFVEAT